MTFQIHIWRKLDLIVRLTLQSVCRDQGITAHWHSLLDYPRA